MGDMSGHMSGHVTPVVTPYVRCLSWRETPLISVFSKISTAFLSARLFPFLSGHVRPCPPARSYLSATVSRSATSARAVLASVLYPSRMSSNARSKRSFRRCSNSSCCLVKSRYSRSTSVAVPDMSRTAVRPCPPVSPDMSPPGRRSLPKTRSSSATLMVTCPFSCRVWLSAISPSLILRRIVRTVFPVNRAAS